MSDESIVVDSGSLMADGNVPPTAPSTPTEPVVPEEKAPVEPTEPAVEPKVELYELPDGRKVSGGEVAQEYKNLLSDYTRKSQELARTKPEILPTKEPIANPYSDPNYIPKSYEEIIKVAEERALNTLAEREQKQVEEMQSIENKVLDTLTEIKKIDPTLNENSLFEHANKYGFQDLKLAHQNMKDMSDVIKKTQTTTAHNIAKRNDPVSISPGSSGQKLNPDDFNSPKDYLRALKGVK